MNPLLELRNLSLGFVKKREILQAVHAISFDVNKSETVALLGESGCGKSISALAIMRLLPNNGRILSGDILFDHQSLNALSNSAMQQIRGGKIAMIFQEPATSLNPVLTIFAQLDEVLQKHTSLSLADRKKEALSLLNEVGISDVENRLTQYPFQLSGGMRQRVMIAMALAGNPRLLIADEPTTALDVTVQAQILMLLKRLQQKRQMGILLITHDLGVVREMADRVLVMYAGQIVESATSETFFNRQLDAQKHPYTQKLFRAVPSLQKNETVLETISGQVPDLSEKLAGCHFAARCSFSFSRCQQEKPTLLAFDKTHFTRCFLLENGGEAKDKTLQETDLIKHIKNNTSEALLRVHNLAVHFPLKKGFLSRTNLSVKAVDALSFTLFAGKTLALVGESGCGKTTVGKALLQLVKATSGEIYLHNQELISLSAQEMRPLRSHLQMIFQDPFSSLNPRLTIGEILLEGILALKKNVDQKAAEALCEALLKEVGLSKDILLRYPHEFSGGQRQRIAICRALLVSPKILICDEPTSALDVSVQAQILNLLKNLQNELGLSYLFITHNFAAVRYLAHEIAVMYLGKIVEFGRADKVLNDPKHPYTQALIAAIPDHQKEKEEGKNTLLPSLGEAASPINPPSGCHFHPRCKDALAICKRVAPTAININQTHLVACHLHAK